MKFLPMKNILKIGTIFVLAIMFFVTHSVLNFLTEYKKISHHAILYIFFAFLIAILGAFVFNRKRQFFVFYLGIVSFVLSISVALWANTQPISDFKLLYELSEKLSIGDLESLRKNAYFTRWAYQSAFVAYQAFIINMFPYGYLPLLIMNAIFITGILILIYSISCEIFKEGVAKFIALSYLLYPAPYFLSSVLTNQHISLFFILLGIFVFTRKINSASAILSGILISIGNAFRPDGIIIIVSFVMSIIVVGFTLHKEGFVTILNTAKPILILILTNILTSIIISTLIIAFRVNPNGQANSDPLWKFVLGLNIQTKGGYSNELDKRVFSVNDKYERHSVELEIITEHLRKDKNELFDFFVNKDELFWGSFETVDWAFSGQSSRLVPIFNMDLEKVLKILKESERLYSLIFSTLSCISLIIIFMGKEIDFMLILTGLIIFVFFVAYTLIEIQSRYRYFIQPFIFVISGVSINYLVKVSKLNKIS